MLHWCPLLGNAKHQSLMAMYVHNSQGTARVVLFHQSTTRCYTRAQELTKEIPAESPGANGEPVITAQSLATDCEDIASKEGSKSDI